MTYAEFLTGKAQVKRPRRAGSCRFSPYYKAQWYDRETLAWRDIAEQFQTEKEARKRFDHRKLWRVMEVTMSGRSVI